ncbi:DNA processing protein [Lachnotalea glycerini]|uniref:DNA processing protein n=1 Tax=Lachnotalea glycerini TaxID=1763509 RepID=A0A318EPU2_9FIRM|nr:DNA-processing protein DprA [Lachnotalea glycerini]PXV93495.1 DNA processing protein [Lachnotalea glycerini]
MTEEESWFWICSIQGLYRNKIKNLIQYYHSPKNVYSMSDSQIKKISLLTEKEKNSIIVSKHPGELKIKFDKLKEANIEFISCMSSKFPRKLAEIPDAPCCLYVKGKIPEEKPSVAIIGARNCSNYGKEIAIEYAKELAANGVQIISGLARGIDSYGHEGALTANGQTFAVLGCGVNICYPKENYPLYVNILKSGGVISEYPMNTQPRSMLFPERNRIISGLADIIIVVEARHRSGSLITSDLALEQGKDIFAVPGRITDSLSSGCNRLISQGAAIVNSPKEIMDELGVKYVQNKKLLKKCNNLLERKENMVYSCLDLQPKSLEEILSNVDLKNSEIMVTLVDLELKGLIKETSKNYYVRINIENHK